jgi:fibronectin-binding autotransporter adhesin
MGSNLTIPGSIVGPGALIKTGLGTLTLTGTNIYSGSTTISQGTLEGDSESLHGTITNSGTLIFNQPSPGSFLRTISGNGNVVVNGPGPLFFT